MAKIGFDTGGIGGIKGRVNGKNKRSGYYYKEMYGETILIQADWKLQDPSPAQLSAQAKFAEASTLANTDMQNPDKKAEWQMVADASNGKYKTARGAAFASYYNQVSTGD